MSLALNLPPHSMMQGLLSELRDPVALLGSLMPSTTHSPTGGHSKGWPGPLARVLHLRTRSQPPGGCAGSLGTWPSAVSDEQWDGAATTQSPTLRCLQSAGSALKGRLAVVGDTTQFRKPSTVDNSVEATGRGHCKALWWPVLCSQSHSSVPEWAPEPLGLEELLFSVCVPSRFGLDPED